MKATLIGISLGKQVYDSPIAGWIARLIQWKLRFRPIFFFLALGLS